MLVAFFSF